MSDLVPPRPDSARPDLARPDLTASDPAGSDGRVSASVAGIDDRRNGGRGIGGRGSTWTWWEAIGVYLGCLVVTSLLAIPVIALISNTDDATFVASALAAVGNVLLLVLWLSRRPPGWQSIIGFPKRVWPEARAGVGFGLLLYPGIAFGIGLVVSALLSSAAGHRVSAPDQVPSDLTVLGNIVTVVYAVLIAPVHEEFFFRGILFRSLRDRYGFGLGATCSGLAFGLVHYVGGGSSLLSNLLLMLTMVFTGFALAYLYERRGNIVAPMIAHATFNTIGVLLIFFVK